MTNEEALNILYKGIAPNPTANNACIELCKKALEKQIPKKPSETDKARCIHCGCVVKRDERFCKNCGQALDWSDTE